jgi:hypothetical protein
MGKGLISGLIFLYKRRRRRRRMTMMRPLPLLSHLPLSRRLSLSSAPPKP